LPSNLRPGALPGAAAIVLTALLLSSTAYAVAAPGLDWRTLRTACCDVHFPVELEPVARRVAVIADESVRNASELLKSAPLNRVQVVLHDVTDSPNGFTQVVPYDVIDLRAITPQGDSDLANTDEYMRLLVQHEILHVVHLDTISGVPAVVNIVLGKVWPPNVIQPRLIVEGLATYAETRFTDGGRLRSTLFKSDVLLGALANDLWDLDDVANYSRRSPGAGAAYSYGASFVEWLSRRYGPEIWAAIAHDYGGDLIPYAMQRSVEKATGHDVETDYRAFLDDVRAEAELLRDAAAARGGPTKARRLTRVGGAVGTFRFDGDDVVVAWNPPNGPPGLYRLGDITTGTPRLEPRVRLNEAADVALVDGRVVLSQVENVDGWRNFGDLWRLDDDGALRRVTRGARLSHPSPLSGSHEVVAEQRTALDSAVVRVDVDTGAMVDVIRSSEGPIWYTPEASPDGASVVTSRWMPGGARDIVEIDVATGAQRVLTHDGATDLEPSYTPDGRHVLFSSDREGMFSIYAVDRETRVVHRVVDSLGVTHRPRATPDGRAVIYVDTHVDGQDLYAAPLDLSRAPVVGDAAPAPPERALTPPTAAPLEAYNPFPTLLPQYWLPIVATDPTGAPAVGAAVVGEDAAGLVSWSAQATYGTGLGRPRVSSTWRIQDLPLPLVLNGEWRTDRSSAVRRTDGLPDEQQETVLRGAVSLQVPFFRQRRGSHSVGVGYTRELHFVENPITSPPDARAPVYPPSANVAALSLDWGYNGVESYRDSISTERGFTSFLRLRHGNRLLGSEQDITELFVDARTFEPVPGLGGHVVGLYLSGGVGFGDRLRRTSFFLGGFEDRDITRDLLEGFRSAGGALRGYPTFAMSGDAEALATLEYRFPLVEVERGPSTLPLFFERVHAALFTDLGSAFSGAPLATQFRAGVGAEIRAQIVVGYYGFLLLRFGYARGVMQGGVDQPYMVVGVPY
jgi:hypothetical protein